MNFETLLEVRNKNLDKLGGNTFFDIASENPTELLRLFYSKFKKAGFDISDDSVRKGVNNIKDNSSGRSLTYQNSWFEKSQERISIELGYESLDIEVRMRIDTNKLYYKIKIDWNDFDREIKITNKSANQVVNKIVDETLNYTKELNSSLTNKSDYEARDRKVKELNSKEKEKIFKDIEKLKTITKRFGFNSYVDKRSENTITFNIKPSELWGISLNRYNQSDVEKYLSSNLKELMKKFSFGFQFDNLKRVLPHILRQVKKSGLTIIKGPHFGSDMMWFETQLINPDNKLPDTSDTSSKQFSYKENEDRNIERFIKVLDEKSEENLSTESDVQYRIIRELLSAENVK